jgi:hypothetical protein
MSPDGLREDISYVLDGLHESVRSTEEALTGVDIRRSDEPGRFGLSDGGAESGTEADLQAVPLGLNSKEP